MRKKISREKDGIPNGGAVARPDCDDPLSREQQIAKLAYERAEARGFAPGHEMEDWLDAEAEIDGDFAPHWHTASPAGTAATHRR